ncbi:DUF3604 domain-containing protein, partial [Novosphingobium marinum]
MAKKMRMALAGATILSGAAAIALTAGWAGAQDAPEPTTTGPASESRTTTTYSPVLQEPLENNLYFGDLHLHTNLSPDAFL